MQVGVKYKVVYLKCEGLRGSPVALAALANLRKWRGSAAVAYYRTIYTADSFNTSSKLSTNISTTRSTSFSVILYAGANMI